MRHHLYNPDFKFIKEPVNFDKHTSIDILKYCLGAVMYMPGTKDFSEKIINEPIPGLTTIVFCFEDACPEDKVEEAEDNVCDILDKVNFAISQGKLNKDDIPLIFCRVRNVEQFKSFSKKLTKERVSLLTGINFPKFNSGNGKQYFEHLRKLNKEFGDILYGMPIIEDKKVAFIETRISELMSIKSILDNNKDLVLQVRVGATDFSSYFGVRRGVEHSVYDIMIVREILSDILNIFARNNDYVVSGPVWEYFRVSKSMMFEKIPDYDFSVSLRKLQTIYNPEVDGLLRELILDRANGFVGRTIIHPTHIKFVNAMQAVTLEEYNDALQILDNIEGGVVKSNKNNKMNEIKPHTNWATSIYFRAQAFGVIEDRKSYFTLFDI